jgi:hypothetical protein
MKRGRKTKPEVSPELAAIERLVDDGASSNATIRKRIALIAAERKLDPSETMAMMKGRWLRTFDLCQFAEKHSLSVSWLIHGDLKGLHRMMGKPCAGVSTVERIMEKYGQLAPDLQRIVTEQVNRMLAERAVEAPEQS